MGTKEAMDKGRIKGMEAKDRERITIKARGRMEIPDMEEMGKEDLDKIRDKVMVKEIQGTGKIIKEAKDMAKEIKDTDKMGKVIAPIKADMADKINITNRMGKETKAMVQMDKETNMARLNMISLAIKVNIRDKATDKGPLEPGSSNLLECSATTGALPNTKCIPLTTGNAIMLYGFIYRYFITILRTAPLTTKARPERWPLKSSNSWTNSNSNSSNTASTLITR